tara:strand:- start:672 stop:914 length:243 start_codon:yes stop_codon:yes gene_type:complete
MTTTEQFYANYEFSDEKVNDSGELTEDRVIEMLEAFYEYKVKESVKNKFTKKSSTSFYCREKGFSISTECEHQCPICKRM